MSLVSKLKWQYLLLVIILIYLFLRVPSLTLQPIFADEAIYIRWAQIAKAEPGLRFISLQDGKTPLFMWTMAPFLAVFEDPLFAGRMLSVVAGLFTLLGAFLIGKNFFNLRIGLLGAFLVTITPFMVFFDRMALVDSMLAAFTIWSIYWGLKLAQEQSIKNAVILGILLGCGWLTKTPGMINIFLLLLFGLFFDFQKKNRLKSLITYGSFFVLSAMVAGGLYLVQKTDPNFHQLSARNSDYIHPLSRLLQYPFDPLTVHFQDTLNFSYAFLGPLLFVMPFIIIFALWQKNKIITILILWSLIPFVYELQFIKAYTGRYILFSVPPLLVVSAFVINLWWEKRQLLRYATLTLVILSFIWSLYFSETLLTNPATTPLARAERRGYLEDWTAGYGLKEIASYLIDQSQNQVIVVGTEGSFGTLPDGLLIYLDRYFHKSSTQKIIVLGDGPKVTETVRDYAKEKSTFFVANKSRYPAPEEGIELIKEYPKIKGTELPPDSILFYRVHPVK